MAASVGRCGRRSIPSDRSNRSTRASCLGPTPYSAVKRSVRWRRLHPTSAASVADLDPPGHHCRAGATPRSSPGGRPTGSRHVPTAPAAGRRSSDGEALGPRRRRGVEAVEQLAGESSPQRVERDDGRGQRPGRQAEQRPGAGRGDLQLHAVLVAVVADHRRARVQAAEHGVEAGQLATSVGQTDSSSGSSKLTMNVRCRDGSPTCSPGWNPA